MNQLQQIRQPKTETLLSTKLTVPRLRAPLVMRPSLLARLDEGLDRKLTLVSAPAGSGKTTLVSQWLLSGQHEQLAKRRAWVALDAGDNDPVRFWRYVFSACQRFGETVGKDALTLLTMQQPAFEAALTEFINDMAQLDGRHVLVLEDYHLITSPQIHEMVLFLLDHLPDSLHLMMLTRHDPPLPLARLRTRHELNEIGVAELRFSLEETQALLQQSLAVSVPADVATQLAERTEGWVAALRLVVLALQDKDDPAEIERFVANFSGGHGHVLEYLVEEVLHAQPPQHQDFLLQTVFLNRLSGPLCNAVTGRTDSAMLLEQMERANLFLISLDGVQQWYRYHGLFAEAISHYARNRLDAATIRTIYERASRWYEENGLLGDALESALATQAYDRAAMLLEEIIAPQLVQNHFHTLRHWLEQLPDAIMRLHPQLCLTFGISILFTSDRFDPATHRQIEPLLQWAEETWRAEGNDLKLGELLAFRSLVLWFRPDVPKAILAAREALSLLPADNVQWRGICLIFVGLDEYLKGRLHVAKEELLNALALNRQVQNTYGTIDTLVLLGRVCTDLGELRQAAQYYETALAEIEQRPIERTQAELRKGRSLAGLGALALEWNEIEKAEACAEEAIKLSNAHADETLRVEANLLMAQTLQAQGKSTEAQALLHALIAQTQQPHAMLGIFNAQTMLALLSGDVTSLQGWKPSPPDRPLPLIQREAETLLAAHIALAQDKPQEALSLLDELHTKAMRDGRNRHALEMQLTMALAAAALKDTAKAKDALCKALTLAQPHNFQRTLLNAGQEVAEMLRSLLRELKDDALIIYVRNLLLAFAEAKAPEAEMPPVDAALLIEPLSSQERRVLRLLAADLSYPEIANELVVSLNTIKTHVKNIYGKLDVHSREEAAQLARQLHLV